MHIPFFDLKRQSETLSSQLSQTITSVIEKGSFILGEEVRRFEQAFAGYIGASHCIGCANGTDALELALEAIGIQPGDEVIIPAFGWISVYTAVHRSGGIPVFVDVDLTTGNLDPAALKAWVSPKSKALIVMHLYGNAADMAAIQELCHEEGLLLIEDCAQAHGTVHAGKRLGSFGDLSTFSFYPTKNLGCFGDGGAVLTSDPALSKRLRALSNYGRGAHGGFDLVGRNSRLDELQAAILSLKLNYLDRWNERRRAIAARYLEVLEGKSTLGNGAGSYHQFCLRVKDREGFVRQMQDAGIGTAVHYPFAISTAYRASGHFPNAEMLSQQLVSVPIYPELTEIEISYICDHLLLFEEYIL